MITTFWSLSQLLPAVVLGCAFGGHHATARPVAAVGCCDTCGIESAKVHAELTRLACAPKWTHRDNAAHELGEFDWRCHPEILPALVHALLTDGQKHVRHEAAQALGKLSPPPCTPEVHLALDRAARCDPHLFTRKAARKSLGRIGRGCVEPCGLCGPEGVIAAPMPGAYPAEPPFLDAGPFPTGRVVSPPGGYTLAPGGAFIEPPADALPPGGYTPPPSGPLYSEPGFDAGALPPLDGPAVLPQPGPPSPAVPPLPGDFAPFGPPPEARRALDGRISAREIDDTIRDGRVERISVRDVEKKPEPKAERPAPRPGNSRRLSPFGLLRRGR